MKLYNIYLVILSSYLLHTHTHTYASCLTIPSCVISSRSFNSCSPTDLYTASELLTCSLINVWFLILTIHYPSSARAHDTLPVNRTQLRLIPSWAAMSSSRGMTPTCGSAAFRFSLMDSATFFISNEWCCCFSAVTHLWCIQGWVMQTHLQANRELFQTGSKTSDADSEVK